MKAWLLLGLAACALLYGPRLSAPLIWDDRPTIVFNDALDHPIPLSDFARPSYFGFSGEFTWRPMATLSYYAMIRAAGKNPLALRGLMFTLHLFNATLLAILLSSLGLPAAAGPAAALFLIHPAHTETLMCVSFNEELLSAFGILSMLILHRKRRFAWAALGLAFALLSKETGVVALPLCLLADHLIEKNVHGKARAYALYGAVAAAYLWVRFIALPGPGGENGVSALLPLTHRALFSIESLVAALRLFVLPLWLRIEYFPLPPESAAAAAGWIIAALIGAAALGRLWRTTQTNAERFLLLWPIPFLLLTANILPTGVLSLRYMAERWLYLPFLGLCACLAARLAQRPRALLAIFLFWSALTAPRLADWSSEPRLWESLARIYPWCAKAHEGEGEALYHAGEFSAARAAFGRALELREKREDKVLSYYTPMTRAIGWESASLYRWLGLSDLELGQAREAEDFFFKAVALEPADGFSYRVLSYLGAARGDFAGAKRWLDQGLKISPGDDFLLRLKPEVERKKLTLRARFS